MPSLAAQELMPHPTPQQMLSAKLRRGQKGPGATKRHVPHERLEGATALISDTALELAVMWRDGGLSVLLWWHQIE